MTRCGEKNMQIKIIKLVVVILMIFILKISIGDHYVAQRMQRNEKSRSPANYIKVQ